MALTGKNLTLLVINTDLLSAKICHGKRIGFASRPRWTSRMHYSLLTLAKNALTGHKGWTPPMARSGAA